MFKCHVWSVLFNADRYFFFYIMLIVCFANIITRYFFLSLHWSHSWVVVYILYCILLEAVLYCYVFCTWKEHLECSQILLLLNMWIFCSVYHKHFVSNDILYSYFCHSTFTLVCRENISTVICSPVCLD